MSYLGFFAQINQPDENTRVYLHKQGVEAWGDRPRSSMISKMITVLTRRPEDSHLFLATVVTAPEKLDIVLDLYCFRDIHPWPGNPEITTLRFNGENDWFPKEIDRIRALQLIRREDKTRIINNERDYEEARLILLSSEVRYLGTTFDLEDFVKTPPLADRFQRLYWHQ